MIWIPNETEAWEPAQLLSSDAKSVTVKLKNGKEVKIPGAANKFDAIPSGALEEDCDNLVNLENFSEGIILHHVKKRFAVDEIYTFVGTILVAVNPYKPLNIYDVTLVDKIYNLTKFNGAVPPHVFSIGAAAVYNMRHENKDQSVLISGESGAGKTEATKKILQFISTVCASTASRIGGSIENQILDSNPLLESFGNAKTIRNNNSSRFGKYMEVNFDKKYHIKGCNIKAYLLEKSRVVKQGPNERNYHIFYMLLTGANKDMKKNFFLKPADQFYYLSQSNCIDIVNRSEKEEYDQLIYAMNSLAIDNNMQNLIMQCLAGILHLGNLTFAPSRETEGGSRATVPADCRRIATLFGLNPDHLENSICTRTTVINNEITIIPLTPEKAVDQRDTLAKYIYNKIFTTIVMRLNTSLYRGKPGNNIGILDIFGFEVFQLNSFEQLCINYCNERLQTFFNEIIFESEMKLYSEEGLPCEDISFQDNIGCVRLIDLRGAGIFAYLDEEIVMPKGSDEKFVSKLNQIFEENASTRSVYYLRQRRAVLDFTVRHFAGDVTYHAKDFMEKNRDSLAEALVELLQQSSIPLLVSTPETTDPTTNSSNNNNTTSSTKKKSTKLTLASKFKLDLDNLMTTIRSTIPHFIRCIKPNSDQIHSKFDSNLILNQLKYSGLFEAIRIRKSGYSIRISHDIFIKRYKHICLNIPIEVKQDNKLFCEYLLKEMEKEINYNDLLLQYNNNITIKNHKISLEEYKKQIQWYVGKTKVFIRTTIYKLQLEKIRDSKVTNCSVPLQKIVRGFIMRNRFIHKIQQMRQVSNQRRQQESNERDLMSKEEIVSMAIEQATRSDAALQSKLAALKTERIRVETEKKQLIQTKSITLLQKIIRGKIYRNKGRIYMCETMLEMALNKRDEKLINRAIIMPNILNVTSKLIKIYINNAKKLIMEVLNEAHVANQLLEAMVVGSLPLLKDAISHAEDANMRYLSQYRDAKRALIEIIHLRTVLSNIDSVLVKCITVPKLIAHADELEELLLQATELDLCGEYQVQDAAVRLGRVRRLIQLRDRIRFAVEVCCPSKMQSTIMERAKLLRIYGPELFQEEAAAVEGMFRMLNYQQSIDSSQLETGNDQQTGTDEGDRGRDMGNDTQLSMQEFHSVVKEIESESVSVQGLDKSGGDIYLPPFIRKGLEEMLSADDSESLKAAQESVLKLVPIESRRRFYQRVFKWVVAFATWRYGEVRTRLREGNTHSSSNSDATCAVSPNPHRTPTKSSTMDASFASSTGLNTSQNSIHSPKKHTPTTSRLSSGKKLPSSPNRQPPHDAPYIPFAERQARSKVAAHEMLKKGKEVHHVEIRAKTDTLLKETIAEYGMFKTKFQPKSTFRG